MGTLEVQKVAGIKFNNYKKEEQQLMLFLRERKGKKIPSGISIVYGANGSGKTTISRAISNCVNNTPGQSTKFINEDGKALNDEIENLDNVFIFNEDFINNNILIKDDGIKTIVLIGEDINLSAKLEENEQKLEEYRRKKEIINNRLEKLYVEKKTGEKTISNTLKKDKGWAQREAKILKHKRKAAVTDEIIKSMVGESISKKRNPLIADEYNNFHNELDNYSRFSEGRVINNFLNHISDPYPLARLVEMFGEVQQRNSFSGTEIELRLSERKLNLSQLEDLRQKIIESNDYCPSCFQDFEDNYRATLLAAIQGFVSEIRNSEKAKKVITFTRTISLPQLEFCRDILSEEMYECVLNQHSEIMSLNEKINHLIEEKAGTPFEAIDFKLGENWINAINEVNNSYNEINSKISEWNEGVSEKKRICNDLQKLNRTMALSEIYSEAIKFDEICNEIITQKTELGEIDRLVSQIVAENGEIKARMAQTKHAADLINNFLLQIFGSDRLALKTDDQSGQYVAYSRGVKVAPETLSTGERNILALCYFFVSCAKDSVFSSYLAKPKLIVLDDPVSSFDYEHKYGVMMFIYNRIHEVLEASKKASKFLLLTHDLSVAYELDKMFIGLDKFTNRVSLALSLDNVVEKDFSKYDFYQVYLEEAYDYVFGAVSKPLNYSRNNIRRLFEAYVTFVLKQDVSNWIDSTVVRDRLGEINNEVDLLRYFESRPIRAYIHQDSHSKEQMIRGNWMILHSLPDEELKRLIEDVLLLMYFLTPTHVLARFSGKIPGDDEVLDNFKMLEEKVKINFSSGK